MEEPASSGDRLPAAFGPRRARTFVLHLVLDAQGRPRGAVSEPGSDDEWRSTFASLDQLLVCLAERLCL